MSSSKKLLSLVLSVFAFSSLAVAGSPQDERHELMEGVKDGAQVIGPMLQGKVDYDADAAVAALKGWEEAAQSFGDLFPDGSEGGEAAPAIWEDRAGFEEALQMWQDATAKAIAANPQTLEEARPAIGPVFDTCKNCHDTYRIEEDE
ncbi:MAG: cytochrome c [Woeseiaceae bacterium]|nr:cytochrome c [Woeseiaceae bacterium]